MNKDLETIYENMLNEPLVLRVVKQPIPLPALDAFEGEREEEEDDYEEEDRDENEKVHEEEELTEAEEVEIAREILSHVSKLDDIAKEAMYKSFRKKIEKHSDAIRDLANELIEAHGYDV
jgi:hypothetical protein